MFVLCDCLQNLARYLSPLSPPLSRLLREDEIKAIQWEAEEVKKDRDKVSFRLRNKEWECDSLKMDRYGDTEALSYAL